MSEKKDMTTNYVKKQMPKNTEKPYRTLENYQYDIKK